MMPQTKAPLSERDTNVASKKPNTGKGASTATEKASALPHPSLEEVANKITQTHGKKRAHEDDQPNYSHNPNTFMTRDDILNMKAKQHEDDDDVDDKFDDGEPYTFDCNQVRRKINALVKSGEIKVGEFQNKLGVSSSAWSNFMKQSGKDAGQFSDTYMKAHNYFVRREREGIKIPHAKKAKTSTTAGGTSSKSKSKDADGKYDISNVTLDDESPSSRVSIFDTCDDLRTKMNAYLKGPGLSQAGLARALSPMVQSTPGFDEGQGVTAAQVRSFLQKKGPRAGATSVVYYAGYVFFEKVRVKQGKPKSKKRTEMEEVHGPMGCPTDVDANTGFWLGPGEQAYEDKYGIVQFVQLPPGASLSRSKKR